MCGGVDGFIYFLLSTLRDTNVKKIDSLSIAIAAVCWVFTQVKIISLSTQLTHLLTDIEFCRQVHEQKI